jgi:hypothetical protein
MVLGGYLLSRSGIAAVVLGRALRYPMPVLHPRIGRRPRTDSIRSSRSSGGLVNGYSGACPVDAPSARRWRDSTGSGRSIESSPTAPRRRRVVNCRHGEPISLAFPQIRIFERYVRHLTQAKPKRQHSAGGHGPEFRPLAKFQTGFHRVRQSNEGEASCR